MFFVGIGAQRSGTTWICQFLRGLPDVSFSPVKEMCYFDSKHVDFRKNALRHRIHTKLALLGLGNYCRKHPLSGLRLIRHYSGVRSLKDASYRAFFDELARKGAVAGEISPSYVALHEEAIKSMDALLDQPNYFFIMRNPIDRLVSQYSFQATLRQKGKLQPQQGSLLDELRRLSKTSYHTNYPMTLKTYQAVLPKDRFRVMFTEHLFDPLRHQEECNGLCDYLGVSRKRTSIKRAVNRAPEILISSHCRTILAAELADSYIGVTQDFAMELPDSWQKDLRYCQ